MFLTALATAPALTYTLVDFIIGGVVAITSVGLVLVGITWYVVKNYGEEDQHGNSWGTANTADASAETERYRIGA